jgi:hypothetical protein
MLRTMDRIIPISDLQTKAKKYVESYEGMLAMLDEMSFPDWRKRLERARRESKAGKSISLETYLARRKRRKA